MNLFVKKLDVGGSIITTVSGPYSVEGESKPGRHPGAPTGPQTEKFRILGHDGLASLCQRYQLESASFPPPMTDVRFEPNERVWVLTKRSQ